MSLSSLPNLRVTRSWQYGRVALGHFLWRQLGLRRAVNEALNGIPAKGRLARPLEFMVLHRLDDPTSKLGLLDWMPGSAAPFLPGIPPARVYDNQFYRAMDALWAWRDALEQRIHQRIVRPASHTPGVLYHDLTSPHYEGEGGPPRSIRLLPRPPRGPPPDHLGDGGHP